VQLSGDRIRTIGSAVTIAVGAGGIIWYVASLEARVRQLETEVHTLAVAPTLAGTNASQPSSVVNPVAQACAEMARRATDDKLIVSIQQDARSIMRELGCVAPR
jgi:hypothetical protein